MEIVIGLLVVNVLLLGVLLIRTYTFQKETKWQLAKVIVMLNWHEQLLKSVFAVTPNAEKYFEETFPKNKRNADKDLD